MERKTLSFFFPKRDCKKSFLVFGEETIVSFFGERGNSLFFLCGWGIGVGRRGGAAGEGVGAASWNGDQYGRSGDYLVY